MKMVSWGWVVMAFFAGVVFGIFLLAFAEVSRRNDDEGQHKGWYDG